MTMEILNPEVCEDCQSNWTTEDEWVMDVYTCDNQHEYCLNCCGCDDHKGTVWYRTAQPKQ